MTTNEIMVKMVFDRWNTQIENFGKTLHNLTDEQLVKEISPGKNRGIYVLGHLVAIHDHMLPLLGLGEKMYPQLIQPFVELPDKKSTTIPNAQELRKLWSQQVDHQRQQFGQLSTDNWFEKHTAVSDEDFAKEPYRNKLNVIVTRTSHLSYHLGQFNLLK